MITPHGHWQQNTEVSVVEMVAPHGHWQQNTEVSVLEMVSPHGHWQQNTEVSVVEVVSPHGHWQQTTEVRTCCRDGFTLCSLITKHISNCCRMFHHMITDYKTRK